MPLIHIMERGGEDAKRFEDAMYDIADAVDEMCEIYDKMKAQYGSGHDSGYSERGMHRRDDRSHRGVYGERHMRR